jgi:hypothetical protein
MTISTFRQAQGTQLSIAGTAGSAITVTAATKASPCVLSCANTMAVGDIGVFPDAGLTGMPELGGRIFVVTAATGSAVTTNIDASGFAAAGTGGSFTPQTWVRVANLSDFDAFNGTADEFETSHLESEAKEYGTGLEDMGSLTGNVQFNPTDAGQLAMIKAKSAGLSTYFRLKYPGGTTARAFKGAVKKFSESGQTGGAQKGSFEVRISGRVSRQEVVN